jgi:hypothetical protein
MVPRSLGRCPEGLMHTHMLKALAGGCLFAIEDEVFEAKLQRVSAKLACNLIDRVPGRETSAA